MAAVDSDLLGPALGPRSFSFHRISPFLAGLLLTEKAPLSKAPLSARMPNADDISGKTAFSFGVTRYYPLLKQSFPRPV